MASEGCRAEARRAKAGLAWIGDQPLRVLAFYDGRRASLATRVWQFRYWLHIGDFAGWPVRVLWIFVGLAPAGFVATGLWLWRDRGRQRSPAS